MMYGEARIAALSGSLMALQSKIDQEKALAAPDAAKLSDFRCKLNRIKVEIDSYRTKLASAV